MAQRLRSLQRGAALLIHHAEASTSGAQALWSVCSSSNSMLTQLQYDQDYRRNDGHWRQHAWGGTFGARSFWSLRGNKSATTTPTTVDHTIKTDEQSAPTEVADPTPPGPPEYFPLAEDQATEVASAIHQACDALERASIMGAKADAMFTASWCISGLQAVHDYVGTPWWISIAIFNISLRCLTFPLMVESQKATAKMMNFNHGILHAKKLQEAAMKATSQQEHDRLMRAFRAEYTAQVAKQGDPMWTGIRIPAIMLLNGGIFLSIFSGISKLMEAKVPSLTTGGALWFSDLTAPDPYFGLPIMCTLVTLTMVEYGINLMGDSGQMQDERAQAQKTLKWVLRFMSLLFIPAGSYVAAGTAMLWVSNTAFGVVQGLVLRSDGFRRRVGLPTMQAMREMNLAVMEANNASAPKPPSGFGAGSAATKAAEVTPAVNTPLLNRQVKAGGARR